MSNSSLQSIRFLSVSIQVILSAVMLAVSGCSAQEDGTDNPVAAEVSSLSATAGDTSVTLQWKDPSPDTFDMIEITHTP